MICTDCHAPAAPLDWQCTRCGGILEIEHLPLFQADAIIESEWSLWRYAPMLPARKLVSLGEGMTPLVDTELNGVQFRAKLDYLNPTGSYKDRGIAVLLNHLLANDVRRVVADSSGNAGASLAMYSGRAGIEARIFAPMNAPAGKKHQIQLSAELVQIGGSRADVTDACMKAAESPGVVYATHAWNPFFIAGQMTIAWELWEQNGRKAPGAVVCPVGQGLLLLGLARGFNALKTAGLIDHVPRLFAIQPAACDPVVRGWENRDEKPLSIEPEPTVADGTAIRSPVHGKEVLKAIRDTNGRAIRVRENAILEARTALAKTGLFVEPTSAMTAAALPEIQRQYDGSLVVILTGLGFKAMDV